MPEYMKAVDIRGGDGPASALFISPDVPKPTPGPGQALVKVVAFGLNRMDLIQRVGKYPVPPQAPKTLGVEFSGVVVALGPGGENAGAGGTPHSFRVGDAVFGLAYGGAYAEYVAVSTRMLMRKPDHLSHVQAGSMPETWITATQALFAVGRFQADKTVLFHAGASGVSIAGTQLARRAGAAAVYVTVGSDEKCAWALDNLHVDAAFNYKTQDWADELLRATGGRGVDMIVDFVGGGDYFQKNINAAAMDATVVLLGLMGGPVVKELNIGPILYKRLRIEGSTLRSRDETYQGQLRDKLKEYLPFFKTGELKHFVDKEFAWEDIQEAHEMLEQNVTRGKIVCTVTSNS